MATALVRPLWLRRLEVGDLEDVVGVGVGEGGGDAHAASRRLTPGTAL